MWPMLRSEVYRLRRRWTPPLLVAILVGAVILAYVVVWLTLHRQPSGLDASDLADLRNNLWPGSARAFGLGIVQFLGTLLVILLTAVAIGSEYRWGTIRTILPRASSRSAFLTAKLIVSLLFTALLVAVGYLVALATSLVTSALEGWTLSLGADWLPRNLEALLRTGYVMIPYLALAFLVTIWTRSTAAGCCVAIGVFFLDTPIVTLLQRAGGPLRHAPDILLQANVNAIVHLNNRGTGLGGTAAHPNPWLAAAILAAYSIAFLAVGYWRFQSRDVTSS